MRRACTALALVLASVPAIVAPPPLGAAGPQSVDRACYFAVDGKILVRGRCSVFPLGGGGYTLNTWDHGKPRRSHFAQVETGPAGQAEASWNADPDDAHALDPLGRVRWVDGCWVNRRTRICAR